MSDDLLDDAEAGELAVEFDDQPPEALLGWALERFGARIALCTSFQAEGMVLLDMAWRIEPKVRVFTVDTGRLHQETYDLIDAVRARYGIAIEAYTPEADESEAMTRTHGVNLFYRAVPLRLLCCQVRKVRPLQRVLNGLDAWITGLRRETWASRADIRKIELDHDHGGIAKLSPLADWTHEEVWDYLRAHDVPSHVLYDQGYTSIGCQPCTVLPFDPNNPRSGRWQGKQKLECGIHIQAE